MKTFSCPPASGTSPRGLHGCSRVPLFSGAAVPETAVVIRAHLMRRPCFRGVLVSARETALSPIAQPSAGVLMRKRRGAAVLPHGPNRSGADVGSGSGLPLLIVIIF